ncbi:MAG: thioredoxin family protein [Candidatus ainarchaeum sp.]|nr:thioredoxin family protein [Candidatus ainarchaeum sp.]
MIKGAVNSVRGFLGDKFNLGLVVALLVLGAAVYFSQPSGVQEGTGANVSVHFFYLPTCPHCHEERPIIDELQAEYPQVFFGFHDVSKQDEMMFFVKTAQEHGFEPSAVPVTLIGNKSFQGVHPKAELEAQLQSCVDACRNQNATAEVKPDVTKFGLPFLGETNLTAFSLPVLAVVLGLIDGFNPCAMWVLVYLIAVIAELNDKRRVWLIVGSFLFASGALYFLFMTAWLNAFLLLGYIRLVTTIIGLVALGGGILSVKDYVESRGKVACKVVDAESKKATMGRINELAGAPLTWATILGVVALAFAVNSVEFVCSAAIPAVFTQVLAMSSLSAIEHYGYILLYDFFFMFDDMIIFGMAAFAVSGGMGEKYASFSKIAGGIILLFLGLMLLFAPNLLA